MQNIEFIIRHLSGELNEKEETSFQESLKNDEAFAEEYRHILKIWEQAKSSLKEQVEDPSNRDELIAAIMASHDLFLYDKSNPSNAEKAVRKTISGIFKEQEAAESAPQPKAKAIRMKPGRSLMLALSAAASIAMVLIISNFTKDVSELATAYYEPQNDYFLRDHALITRSDQSKGIAAFHKENFGLAEQVFKKDSLLWEANPWIKIYYAISSYENGEQEKGIAALKDLTNHIDPNISSASTWYLVLYFIKQEKYLISMPLLQKLTEGNSQYSRRADRLLRKIE